jgi:hypothetical protein
MASMRRPEHDVGLRAVLTRVVLTLATAVLVPAVLLWAMLRFFDVTTAVIVALAWMVALMGWRYVARRPVSGLLLLSLAILTVKTAFALLTGNTFVYFVQPVFADVAVAAIFLASVGTARPVIARLAPEFYPMSAALAARPEICALFRRLTLMWGVVILIKAGVTLWLLEALSTADFVLIKGGAIVTLTATTATVTIGWAYVVVRRQGQIQSS